MELGSRTGDRGQRSEVRGRPDGEKAGSAEGHPLAPDRAVRRRGENSLVRKRSGGKERSVQDPPQPVPWVKGQSMAAPQGNSITRSQRRPGDPSSGPWGGQAVSGTEWRRRLGLGGAGPGVLRAGVELGPRCSFSRPLAQQKCDSTTSDREITPVSCCSQQAFGARSHPHRSSDMFMGGGPDVPGYRSTCPAQIPATPRPSLQQAGHRSPSASGTGTLAEEAAVVSKRVPGGCRGAGQPRPLLEKLRCSPGPSLPRPPPPRR